jgi:hypothetical protein
MLPSWLALSLSDKDKSDDKAINKTNQGFPAKKFSISPGDAGQLHFAK